MQERRALAKSRNIQGLNKIAETLQILYPFFIDVVLDHLLPPIQPQPFLEWTHTGVEQNSGNTTNTVPIFYRCGDGPPFFSSNTAATILGMD
jgi:hypothetical protein